MRWPSPLLATASLTLLGLSACGDDSSGTGGSGASEGSSSGATSSSSGGGNGGAGTTTTTSAGGGGGEGGSGGGPLTVSQCYANTFVNPQSSGPDYDQFGPVVGSHCLGTNHQDIVGVQRVVFVGDSITVGTPPTQTNDLFRNKLADALAAKFGLGSPGFLWKAVDLVNGRSLTQSDGAFASCAKWGARTDDLMLDNTQIETCIPVSERSKTTLVIMTMGGNDIASLTKAAIDGLPMDQLWLRTQAFVQLLEDSIAWLKEPGRFPNGVYVVFGNLYEFTDGTGKVQSCDVSSLAGFDAPVPAPDELAALVVWANEQYVRIAVDYQVDVTFMLEEFCGRGFERNDPAAPCYRGPGQPAFFDLTCTHPSPAGHQHLRDMFFAVVDE